MLILQFTGTLYCAVPQLFTRTTATLTKETRQTTAYNDKTETKENNHCTITLQTA